MFRIKICGIRTVEDALAAAEAGADAIGLNFFSKSRRFVDPEVAKQIAGALPAHVCMVGVFVNHDASGIASIANTVGLDVVQLHGDESPEMITRLPIGIRVVRAERCGSAGLVPLARYIAECDQLGRAPDAVLIDADAGAEFGGTGKTVSWELVAQQRSMIGELPMILAGGLRPGNVAEAIVAARPNGVDVASGVESEPGVKDHGLMRQFVRAASRAFELP